jgi:hypothetical protein
MHIPEETEDWFEELSDFLKASTQLTRQGEHNPAENGPARYIG